MTFKMSCGIFNVTILSSWGKNYLDCNRSCSVKETSFRLYLKTEAKLFSLLMLVLVMVVLVVVVIPIQVAVVVAMLIRSI